MKDERNLDFIRSIAPLSDDERRAWLTAVVKGADLGSLRLARTLYDALDAATSLAMTDEPGLRAALRTAIHDTLHHGMGRDGRWYWTAEDGTRNDLADAVLRRLAATKDMGPQTPVSTPAASDRDVSFSETPRHDSASPATDTSPARNGPTSEASKLTSEQWWYVLSRRYRKALDAAISTLEHTSDHHATDARLTLLAATDPEGNDPTYPFPAASDGSLDVAWREAEEAVGERDALTVGRIVTVDHGTVYWAGAGPTEDDLDTMLGGKDTPAEALRELAARLRNPDTERLLIGDGG